MPDSDVRNFNSIQFETLRKKVDSIINDLHDELEETYYQFWKKGTARKWPSSVPQQYRLDILPTSERTKTQFDLAHAALFHLHTILMYKINNEDGDYDADILFSEIDENGNVIEALALVNEARSWLANIEQDYAVDITPLKDYIISWVSQSLSKTIDLE